MTLNEYLKSCELAELVNTKNRQQKAIEGEEFMRTLHGTHNAPGRR